MAWTTPPTWVAGQPITSAFLNALRDNLLETAAAKATTPGSHFVSTGANTLVERIGNRNAVNTSETTTSTSYVDLATPGPSLTMTSSSGALVCWSAAMSNSTANAEALAAIDISGATTQTAVDALAVRHISATANASLQASYVERFPQAPGSSVFAVKYRASTGTATFANRRLSVIPF